MTETKKVLNHSDACELIRKRWSAGRKTVEINGVQFNIRLHTNNASFRVDGETKTQMEYWLIAKPADGSSVPTYNVERESQGNLRSKS